jgi:hypothetical protein
MLLGIVVAIVTTVTLAEFRKNAYSSPAYFWAHSRVAFSAIKKNGEEENKQASWH